MDGNVASLFADAFRSVRPVTRIVDECFWPDTFRYDFWEALDVFYDCRLGCLDAPVFMPAGSMRRAPFFGVVEGHIVRGC